MAESFGSRFSIFRSWGTGVEVISPLGGKGRCLQHLKELLGDRARVTVGVGDYENDLSLLQCADLSYAPANACPEVLAFSKHHLPPCSQGAIAALIEDLDCKLSRGELCL
jgi:hydroxymethylpyrimidine pyrophosphatase-like HAD family hydrolase